MYHKFGFSPRAHFASSTTCLLFALLSVAALAQGPDVRVELTGQRVVTAEGKESFVKADKAGPGDVIQYQAVYRNDGKAAAHSVVATVPIPAGMALVADSAKPAAEQASLDGKNFSATPLLREVKNATGVAEKQAVPLGEYRALRWTLPELPPEKSATLTLRARVLTNAITK